MKTYKQFQNQDIAEDAKMGKQSDDQLKKLYKTASDKDQSSPANKSFTQRVAKEMKKRGISEQEGVRQVDFVDGITGEKETMNEILPALMAVGKVAAAGAKVAGAVAKGGAKAAGAVVKGGAKAAANVAANRNEREAQQKKYTDKQKPQAKKDRDAMGRKESVEEGMDITEVKSAYEKEIADFVAKGGTIKSHTMDKKRIAKAVIKFQKAYAKMQKKEIEKDILDAMERKKNLETESMAYEMNSYVKTLSIDRTRNLWAEAAKQGEDPEPVKGKKSLTGEKQETVTINPKEALPGRGPKIGRLT